MDNIVQINSMLAEVHDKLANLSLEDMMNESEHSNSQHHPYKMSAAQKRLQQLYAKLTAGRSDANRVQAHGAKR